MVISLLYSKKKLGNFEFAKIFLFFSIFIYLFICFKYNIFSFENFISNTDKKHIYGFYDVIKWELDFFRENYIAHVENDNPYTYELKFINLYVIKFFKVLGFEYSNFKDYFNLIVNFYIFLFSFFSSILLVRFAKFSSYGSSLIAAMLLSFTPPLYVYLRCPTFIGPMLLCFIFVTILSFFKFNKILYFLSTSIIYFVCMFFSPAMFFIYISILLVPFIFIDGTVSFLDFKKIFRYKTTQAFVVICLVTFFYILFSQILYLKNNINFVQQLAFPKINYYQLAFNKCESIFFCYIVHIIGESRTIWDTFYTYIPFFYASDNPWDGTISKEIRIFSPLNLTIIVLICSFSLIKKRQDLVLQNFSLLSFFSFLTYFLIFPYQVIAYEFTPGWILFPYFISLLCFFAAFLQKFVKFYFVLIVFIFYFLTSIYRFFSLETVKFLIF